MDPRLRAAVDNNAEWCDLVCRSQGLPTVWSDQLWIAPNGSPPLYPDAITLVPEVPPDLVLRDIRVVDGCSVKDSFADLELGERGFVELFEATWLAREPAPARAVPRLPWATVASDVLDDPTVTLLEVDHEQGVAGGATVNLTGSTLGVSNVFASEVSPAALWSDLPAAVGELVDRLPLVGYEHGERLAEALAAGFEPIGPLRVWLMPRA